MGNNLLKNFKVHGSNSANPFVSITVNGLSFSKESAKLLGYPEYVTLFLNEEDGQFAVQPTEKNKVAQRFFNPERSKERPYIRWNNKNVIGPILRMLPDDRDPNGVRVYGRYYEEENCIIYDCNQTDKLLRGKKRRKENR